MTQNPLSQTIPSDDAPKTDDLRALQKSIPDTDKTVQESVRPQYPNWPTSKPGPHSTPPPSGMRSMSAMRSEQMKEVGYNQETGEPGVQSPSRSMPDASMEGRTSFDQQETAQESLKKRKERL